MTALRRRFGSALPGARRLASRRRAFALAAASLFVLLGLVVLSIHDTGDYNVNGLVGGDNAGPGLTALLHGTLHGYIDHQPIIGLTSILLRLPVMAAGSALGAGSLLNYELGAFACMLPLALLGAWLITRPELGRRDQLLAALAVLLVVCSPIVRGGISAGHPEGTLSKVLATAAVILATRGRVRWAAVVLGLAVSAKETALIALPPVLIALPQRRRQVLLLTGATVFAFTAVIWLSDPGAFRLALHGEGGTRFLTPLSLLWPISSPVHIGGSLAIVRLMPLGLHRLSTSGLTLTLAMTVGATWYVRARRRGGVCDPMALLVLLGTARCVCDSTHEAYYWTSVLIPLGAWEALRGRVPVATALLSVAVPWLYSAVGTVPAASLYVAATAGELLLIGHLARHAMASAPSRQSAAARPRPARWAYSFATRGPLTEPE